MPFSLSFSHESTIEFFKIFKGYIIFDYFEVNMSDLLLFFNVTYLLIYFEYISSIYYYFWVIFKNLKTKMYNNFGIGQWFSFGGGQYCPLGHFRDLWGREFSCHSGWGVLLVFGGKGLEMLNVLLSFRQPILDSKNYPMSFMTKYRHWYRF